MLNAHILEIFQNGNKDSASYFIKNMTDEELIKFNNILMGLGNYAFHVLMDRKLEEHKRT